MLAGVYLQAEQEIREAYLLESAKQRLCGAFVETGYYFNPNQRENSEVEEKGADIAMRQIHKHAWRGSSSVWESGSFFQLIEEKS